MRVWLLVFAALVASASTARADLSKPFDASASEVRAAFAAMPVTKDGIVIIHEDRKVALDERGRATITFHRIFGVRSEEGANEWRVLQWTYRPFHQNRPAIRVRAIDPGGAWQEVDPKTYADDLVASGGNARRVVADLPVFKIGSICEEEAIVVDQAPILASGDAMELYFSTDRPIGSAHHEYTAPVSKKAKVVVRNLPAMWQAAHAVVGDRERWTFDATNIPTTTTEEYAPIDAYAEPYAGISATTWTDVAREFRDIVDKRIAAGPVHAQAKDMRGILAWLQKTVRPEDVDFASGLVTPRTPAETLKRTVGSALDRAVLLVAVLRKAGITADLALLDTGTIQPDPDIAMFATFDRVLVRAREGSRDTWLDPETESTAFGHLLSGYQNKRVLLVSATPALVMTPLDPASDNRVKKLIAITPTERATAKITETLTQWGAFDAEYRNWYRDTAADELDESYTTRATDFYGATFGSRRNTAPDDFTHPFETVVEYLESSREESDRASIDIHLHRVDALARVPTFLDGAAVTPRTLALEWPIPHGYEVEHRIAIPTGYRAPDPLPEDLTKQLGPATFVAKHRLVGSTYVVTYKFDIGKPRYTAAEVLAFEQEASTFLADDEVVTFANIGLALSDDRRSIEALAELRRLVALHPTEALHHEQLAVALIDAGAGEAARREARAAIALDPTDPDQYSMLAWTLRHDTLGREFGWNWDRAGSLAAYAKAMAILPTYSAAAVDQAHTLERDVRGALRFDDPQLDAIAAWRAAYKLDPSTEVGERLLAALVRGRDKTAATFAKTLARSAQRDGLLVAATASSAGAAAAIAEAGKLGTPTALADAGEFAIAQRDYALALKLLDAAGSQPMQDVLARLKRSSAPKLTSTDPRDAVAAMFLATFDRTYDPVFFDPTVATLAHAVPHEAAIARTATLGPKSAIDLFVSGPVLAVTGRGPWRVEATLRGKTTIAYVALVKGAARVVAINGAPASAYIASLPANGTEIRTVLDWARTDLDQAMYPVLAQVWGGSVPRDDKAVALAVAIMAMDARSVPVLQKCTSSIADARARCDLALFGALVGTRDWTALAAHATAWHGRSDPDDTAVFARVTALAELGQRADAEAALVPLATKYPDRVASMRAVIAVIARDWPVAIAGLAKTAGVDAVRLNALAWMRVFAGIDLPAGLAEARKASLLSSQPEIMHTIATLDAELGLPDDAMTALDEALFARRDPMPMGNADWYVVGRAYEQLGLRDDAFAIYRKLVKPALVKAEAPDVFELATKRLATP